VLILTNQPHAQTTQGLVSDNDGHTLTNPFETYVRTLGPRTTATAVSPARDLAVIRGRVRSIQCRNNGSVSFELRYNVGTGFSLEDTTRGGWIFGGAGTAANPWRALSGRLENCWGNRFEITVVGGEFRVRSTANNQLIIDRMFIVSW